MKTHFIKRPMYLEEVATPMCDANGLVTTPFWRNKNEIQSHWHRSKVTCGNCRRTKLFKKIKKRG